jgi:hypothetical protein
MFSVGVVQVWMTDRVGVFQVWMADRVGVFQVWMADRETALVSHFIAFSHDHYCSLV